MNRGLPLTPPIRDWSAVYIPPNADHGTTILPDSREWTDVDCTYEENDMTGEMPIGIQDFIEIRKKDYLYVDKSEMISHIVSSGVKVYLYTRPRRFGKSLNLSMLDAFFNLKYPKDNKWFDGLKVFEYEECQKHKNAYPVINFDFKNLDASSYEGFLHKLKSRLSDLYAEFEYLRDSCQLNEVDRDRFMSVFKSTVNDYDVGSTLYNLSSMLYKHHGRKAIILLDEYDNPINNSYGKPFQQDVVGLMRELLSSALKGNNSLEFGVVTGVMQIAKESIFSGLNNLTIDNIFCNRFEEMFGFTDADVRTICEEYGHPERYPEAKEWYDGYRFGNVDVYNPWSILQYIYNGFKPRPYWAGTSGNSILNDLLEIATPDMWDEFRLLAERIPVRYEVNPTITFQDMRADERNIYSMLVMSGYLTATISEEGDSHIFIPNGEMAMVFGNLFLNHLDGNGQTDVRLLAGAFVKGDTSTIEKRLYNLFASSAGNAMLNDEHSYQAFITGMLTYLFGKYSVKADFEGGNGRYDILLERKLGDSPNIVIEIKRVPIDSSDDLSESKAKDALKQIIARDYLHGLRGRTLLYGIAFRNKKATVLSEELYL